MEQDEFGYLYTDDQEYLRVCPFCGALTMNTQEEMKKHLDWHKSMAAAANRYVYPPRIG